ncbi:MAG: extracellular solute-binding protein, partial [Defluviitoga tunisiensis]
MKKFLSVLFLVTLCVVGFSKTTIVHWMHHSPARLEFVDKMAKQFMEENPDVEIVIQSIPLSEYKTKLLAAVAAGSGPDVAQVPGEAMLELYYYQVIQPFPTTVMSIEKLQKDYIEPTVRNLIIDGELYGLPTDVQTIVLFYNPVLFEQAGLDPNRPPEDWNELIEYAKKLTKWEEGKMVQSGWAFEGYDRELETMMRCAGATFWEDEKQTKVKLEPAIIETYEFYKKAIEEHKVYTPEFGSRWTGFRQIKEGMVFGHGAMVGSFMVGSHPDLVFRTAPVPKHPETGKRVTVLTSWSLSI